MKSDSRVYTYSLDMCRQMHRLIYQYQGECIACFVCLHSQQHLFKIRSQVVIARLARFMNGHQVVGLKLKNPN